MRRLHLEASRKRIQINSLQAFLFRRCKWLVCPSSWGNVSFLLASASCDLHVSSVHPTCLSIFPSEPCLPTYSSAWLLCIQTFGSGSLSARLDLICCLSTEGQIICLLQGVGSALFCVTHTHTHICLSTKSVLQNSQCHFNFNPFAGWSYLYLCLL